MLLSTDDSNIATNDLTRSIYNYRNYESDALVTARVNRKQKYDYLNDVHDEQETNDFLVKRQRGSRRLLSLINPDLLPPLNNSFPEPNVDTFSEVETEIDEQEEFIFPVEEMGVETENHHHQNMSWQTTLEKMERETEYRECNYREDNYDNKTPEFRFLSDSQAEEDRDLRYGIY